MDNDIERHLLSDNNLKFIILYFLKFIRIYSILICFQIQFLM